MRENRSALNQIHIGIPIYVVGGAVGRESLLATLTGNWNRIRFITTTSMQHNKISERKEHHGERTHLHTHMNSTARDVFQSKTHERDVSDVVNNTGRDTRRHERKGYGRSRCARLRPSVFSRKALEGDIVDQFDFHATRQPASRNSGKDSQDCAKSFSCPLLATCQPSLAL